MISLPNACPAFFSGQDTNPGAPVGWQHQGGSEIRVSAVRWILWYCRELHTSLLALPRAKSALHSALGNGSESPNGLSEKGK